MPPNVRVLDIGPGTDGDGRKWPKHHYQRNDEYYLERIATDKWIYDKGGPQPDITYRLNKLPHGYAGFQRTRPDGKHVDRYIYGHPNGQFRSLNEFYPHFKHLMDHGGSEGCTCVRCKNGTGKKLATGSRLVESGNDSEATGVQAQRSRYLPGTAQEGSETEEPELQLASNSRPKDVLGAFAFSDTEAPKPMMRRLVDIEGVADSYEHMIDRLKEAEPENGLDLPLEETMSPDWRVGNPMSKTLLQQWKILPRYVPRPGDLVLFVRDLKDGEGIAWDKNSQTFRRMERSSGTWLTQPRWEAGVVTQIPKTAISNRDLFTDAGKEQAINESGFRIEPLSEPGNSRKPYSKQHKYVPLHAIRPFGLWQECLGNVPEKDRHPTIKHALTVASSICIIGRYRFRGVWPNATVFARGVYLGSELIMIGDTVRLLPRKNEQRNDNVTDVMVVTAIRLRFVNLDLEEEDESPLPSGLPYQTCLHISGRVYTLDPRRSFDGVGKVPIDPNAGILPADLSGYGQWYHYTDPKKQSGRIELPYTRILGRCYEDTAAKSWFSSRPDMPPPSSFQAVNAKPIIVKPGDNVELTRGLQGVLDARNYSLQNDKRIKFPEGKAWFWADTRIEQLNLDVVNYVSVGIKNLERTKGQMAKWRSSLKAIDGKKGGLAEYHAARREREQQDTAKKQSAYGMVAASAQRQTESPTEAETENNDEDEEERIDAMEVDDDYGDREHSNGRPKELPRKATPKRVEAITLSDSEDEDEMATNQLGGELVKNFRPKDPRLNR